MKAKLMGRDTLNEDDSGNSVPRPFIVKQHARYHKSALRVLTISAPDVFLTGTPGCLSRSQHGCCEGLPTLFWRQRKEHKTATPIPSQ